MLDGTTRKILKLLSPDQSVETRCAAARVLAELGVRDGEITKVLSEAVDAPDEPLRAEAMRAIGKLRIETALPRLLPRIRAGGAESEPAAQTAARLGVKGTRAVREIMAQAAPGLRRRLAAALASSGTASAETAALDDLLDKDPGVVQAATRSLVAEIPGLGESHRRSLEERVLELLSPPKNQPLPLESEMALLRVLAGLGSSHAETEFWRRIDESVPPEIRAVSLQALGALPPPASKDKLKRLLACATTTDFRILAPVLMILKGIPVRDRGASDWLPLLEAPDVAARRLAIEKIEGRDTPAIAAALVSQLAQHDPSMRELALKALSQREHGREALVEALLDADSADQGWSLARAQVVWAGDFPDALRDKLSTRACAFLEAGDRRADPLLFLLREVSGSSLRDLLEERGVSLRKKKNYSGALAYLRHLGRDPACSEEVRFEIAGCELRLSEHGVTAEARAADPALQHFARLVHSHEVDPAQRLRQVKWLESEDLFYLGFHFSEGTDRREHEFGGQVLNIVIERAPKTKLAKDAKRKLRSLGFD